MSGKGLNNAIHTFIGLSHASPNDYYLAVVTKDDTYFDQQPGAYDCRGSSSVLRHTLQQAGVVLQHVDTGLHGALQADYPNDHLFIDFGKSVGPIRLFVFDGTTLSAFRKLTTNAWWCRHRDAVRLLPVPLPLLTWTNQVTDHRMRNFKAAWLYRSQKLHQEGHDDQANMGTASVGDSATATPRKQAARPAQPQEMSWVTAELNGIAKAVATTERFPAMGRTDKTGSSSLLVAEGHDSLAAYLFFPSQEQGQGPTFYRRVRRLLQRRGWTLNLQYMAIYKDCTLRVLQEDMRALSFACEWLPCGVRFWHITVGIFDGPLIFLSPHTKQAWMDLEPPGDTQRSTRIAPGECLEKICGRCVCRVDPERIDAHTAIHSPRLSDASAPWGTGTPSDTLLHSPARPIGSLLFIPTLGLTRKWDQAGRSLLLESVPPQAKVAYKERKLRRMIIALIDRTGIKVYRKLRALPPLEELDAILGDEPLRAENEALCAREEASRAREEALHAEVRKLQQLVAKWQLPSVELHCSNALSSRIRLAQRKIPTAHDFIGSAKRRRHRRRGGQEKRVRRKVVGIAARCDLTAKLNDSELQREAEDLEAATTVISNLARFKVPFGLCDSLRFAGRHEPVHRKDKTKSPRPTPVCPKRDLMQMPSQRKPAAPARTSLVVELATAVGEQRGPAIIIARVPADVWRLVSVYAPRAAEQMSKVSKDLRWATCSLLFQRATMTPVRHALNKETMSSLPPPTQSESICIKSIKAAQTSDQGDARSNHINHRNQFLQHDIHQTSHSCTDCRRPTVAVSDLPVSMRQNGLYSKAASAISAALWGRELNHISGAYYADYGPTTAPPFTTSPHRIVTYPVLTWGSVMSFTSHFGCYGHCHRHHDDYNHSGTTCILRCCQEGFGPGTEPSASSGSYRTAAASTNPAATTPSQDQNGPVATRLASTARTTSPRQREKKATTLCGGTRRPALAQYLVRRHNLAITNSNIIAASTRWLSDDWAPGDSGPQQDSRTGNGLAALELEADWLAHVITTDADFQYEADDIISIPTSQASLRKEPDSKSCPTMITTLISRANPSSLKSARASHMSMEKSYKSNGFWGFFLSAEACSFSLERANQRQELFVASVPKKRATALLATPRAAAPMTSEHERCGGKGAPAVAVKEAVAASNVGAEYKHLQAVQFPSLQEHHLERAAIHGLNRMGYHATNAKEGTRGTKECLWHFHASGGPANGPHVHAVPSRPMFRMPQYDTPDFSNMYAFQRYPQQGYMVSFDLKDRQPLRPIMTRKRSSLPIRKEDGRVAKEDGRDEEENGRDGEDYGREAEEYGDDIELLRSGGLLRLPMTLPDTGYAYRKRARIPLLGTWPSVNQWGAATVHRATRMSKAAGECRSPSCISILVHVAEYGLHEELVSLQKEDGSGDAKSPDSDGSWVERWRKKRFVGFRQRTQELETRMKTQQSHKKRTSCLAMCGARTAAIRLRQIYVNLQAKRRARRFRGHQGVPCHNGRDPLALETGRSACHTAHRLRHSLSCSPCAFARRWRSMSSREVVRSRGETRRTMLQRANAPRYIDGRREAKDGRSTRTTVSAVGASYLHGHGYSRTPDGPNYWTTPGDIGADS
ncbi:uncharacterized protein EV422DRAFT_581029 [Fimicolochytrium jonesii]|uniref:uncharacterized protein n=1 Tax=Fimicolochytrium jonesii TaxID=1396493 RepID=UPI0022FDEC73|nr:uncharacterized protein EV422DRAFT_581029 [Fimicolochytrium jonesii]KAI8817089.1 hypothetical protein EV422DRAFT_581029 [Fimicolochytrium jonesii]